MTPDLALAHRLGRDACTDCGDPAALDSALCRGCSALRSIDRADEQALEAVRDAR